MSAHHGSRRPIEIRRWLVDGDLSAGRCAGLNPRLVNISGALAGGSDYDDFGAVRSQTGSSSIFGFSGEQTDGSGLVYLRGRYYGPVVGRFLSADDRMPNGPGTPGYNLYGYVANNPTTLTDPSGHASGVEYAANVVTKTPKPFWYDAMWAGRVVEEAGPMAPGYGIYLKLLALGLALAIIPSDQGQLRQSPSPKLPLAPPNASPTPSGSPETATQTSPLQAPAPLDTTSRARTGEPVYRVYQSRGETRSDYSGRQ